MKYLEMGHSYPYFNRNYFIEKEDIDNFSTEHNNEGIYRSAYYYNTNDKEEIKDSYLFSDFYMDFDNEENPELAKEDLLYVIWRMHYKLSYNLPIEAFRIYFSGKKGFHLIIPHQYLGIEPRKDLDNVFRWIAAGLQEEVPNETIDMVVYERRRLWRLENSKHIDTKLFKIPIEYKELVNLSLEKIKELAKKPRKLIYPEPTFSVSANKIYLKEIKELEESVTREKERYKNYVPKEKVFDLDNLPDYITQLLEEGPVVGFRNETAAALTSFYLQVGYNEDETLEAIMNWNNNSLPKNEVKATVHSVFKNKFIYSKKRFQALADKDLSVIKTPIRQKQKPIWKKGGNNNNGHI